MGMMKRRTAVRLLAALLSAPVAFSPSTLAWAKDVDVAIVFAVDASSSIGPSLAALQREGHAMALRSPQVLAAILRNEIGCISVTYIEWSSVGRLRTVVPWRTICGKDDAMAVAAEISQRGDNGSQRRSRGRTSLSFAIHASTILLGRREGNAQRQIIDISANGTNNDGDDVASFRRNALQSGYVINGIVMNDDFRHDPSALTNYFYEEVIGGSGAFVLSVTQASQYSTVLRQKLVQEIGMFQATAHRVPLRVSYSPFPA